MIIGIDFTYFKICPVDIILILNTFRKVIKTKVVIDIPISLFPQPFDNDGLTDILVSFPLNLLILRFITVNTLRLLLHFGLDLLQFRIGVLL